MSCNEFKTEDLAKEEIKRMEEQTEYSFDCFHNGRAWEVYQEEGVNL